MIFLWFSLRIETLRRSRSKLLPITPIPKQKQYAYDKITKKSTSETKGETKEEWTKSSWILSFISNSSNLARVYGPLALTLIVHDVFFMINDDDEGSYQDNISSNLLDALSLFTKDMLKISMDQRVYYPLSLSFAIIANKK